MPVPSNPCCVSTLQQQQDPVTQHHNHCSETAGDRAKSTTKTCTVIEHGRVVVKPVETIPTA